MYYILYYIGIHIMGSGHLSEIFRDVTKQWQSAKYFISNKW